MKKLIILLIALLFFACTSKLEPAPVPKNLEEVTDLVKEIAPNLTKDETLKGLIAKFDTAFINKIKSDIKVDIESNSYQQGEEKTFSKTINEKNFSWTLNLTYTVLANGYYKITATNIQVKVSTFNINGEPFTLEASNVVDNKDPLAATSNLVVKLQYGNKTFIYKITNTTLSIDVNGFIKEVKLTDTEGSSSITNAIQLIRKIIDIGYINLFYL